MIFRRVLTPELTLYVCGSFWPGAKDGQPPPEHFLLTGQVECDDRHGWPGLETRNCPCRNATKEASE